MTLWTGAHQAPLSLGFSRQEYWSGLPFSSPGDLPDPGIKPATLMSPALAGGFFTTSATWEAPSAMSNCALVEGTEGDWPVSHWEAPLCHAPPKDVERGGRSPCFQKVTGGETQKRHRIRGGTDLETPSSAAPWGIRQVELALELRFPHLLQRSYNHLLLGLSWGIQLRGSLTRSTQYGDHLSHCSSAAEQKHRQN